MYEFFVALLPFYSFLNCHLIIRLAVFLRSWPARAELYEGNVKDFKSTVEVNQLQTTLEKYHSSYSLKSSKRVTIVLEKSWGRQNAFLVEELVKVLFGLESADSCIWFNVKPPGSLIVTFLVPQNLMLPFWLLS